MKLNWIYLSATACVILFEGKKTEEMCFDITVIAKVQFLYMSTWMKLLI